MMNICNLKYKLTVILLIVALLGNACVTWYNKCCGVKGCIQSTRYTNWRISQLQNTCPNISRKGAVNATIQFPVFIGVKLKDADFSGTYFGNKNNKYKYCEECRPNFAGANLMGCRFVGATINHVNFSGMPSCDMRALVVTTKIVRCNFTNADIQSANVTACEVVECDFNNADLQGTYANRYMLSVCDEANVGAVFKRCKFVSTNMKYCKNLNILDSDLSQSDLRGSKLHLVNCVIKGANVCGLDLRPIVCGKSQYEAINALKHVVYDDATVWPDGIRPEQCDAIRSGIGRQSKP